MTLQLAARLGRREWNITRLQDMLKKVLEARQTETRRAAIDLWLVNPKTRDNRIEKLLKQDPSVITLYHVFLHLHLRRQDLLDDYLSGKAIKGFFLSEKAKHLLPA